jgi:hypothetical protein
LNYLKKLKTNIPKLNKPLIKIIINS